MAGWKPEQQKKMKDEFEFVCQVHNDADGNEDGEKGWSGSWRTLICKSRLATWRHYKLNKIFSLNLIWSSGVVVLLKLEFKGKQLMQRSDSFTSMIHILLAD